VDFGELSDKAIKGLTCLSKNVSKFLFKYSRVYVVMYLRMNVGWFTLNKASKCAIL
jgi:hypothetical protein